MIQMQVRTQRRAEFVNITSDVQEAVLRSGVGEGWAMVFVPHTTAGITINENADPDVVTDMLAGLARIAPESAGYRHSEGNADAHIKASLMGSSVTVPVHAGRLVLGTWQGIYFCEFDGPRTRQAIIAILGA